MRTFMRYKILVSSSICRTPYALAPARNWKDKNHEIEVLMAGCSSRELFGKVSRLSPRLGLKMPTQSRSGLELFLDRFPGTGPTRSSEIRVCRGAGYG